MELAPEPVGKGSRSLAASRRSSAGRDASSPPPPLERGRAAAQRTRSGTNGRSVERRGDGPRSRRGATRYARTSCAKLAEPAASEQVREVGSRSSRGSRRGSRRRPGRRASPSSRCRSPPASRTTARACSSSRTARPGTRRSAACSRRRRARRTRPSAGRAFVFSTIASAYGRSSKPRSSKYTVNVFWRSPIGFSCPVSVLRRWSTVTAIADESIPPERQVPIGTSLRSWRRTESKKASRTASTGSPAGGIAILQRPVAARGEGRARSSVSVWAGEKLLDAGEERSVRVVDVALLQVVAHGERIGRRGSSRDRRGTPSARSRRRGGRRRSGSRTA